MVTFGVMRADESRDLTTRLCVLGVVRGESCAESIELHGVQPRLVCAYLATRHGRVVPSDELAQLLWPDVLSPHWEGAVRGVVSKVRAFLHGLGPSPPLIENVDHGYRLVLPVTTTLDIDDAERSLAEAVHHLGEQRWGAAACSASASASVLRESLLPGLDGEWIERVRAELLAMRCRACRVAAMAFSRDGRHDDSVVYAEMAVADDGFDEQNHRALMAAHLVAGNRGAALRAYGGCRRLLAEQLGVSPSDATEQLYLRVLAAESCTGRLVEHRFAGRRRELSVLSRAWERSMACGSQIVLVHGEAGAGKTALVLEAARASQASNVLYGHCSAGREELFEPFAEAIGRVTEQMSPLELFELVSGFEVELAALVPSIAGRLGIRPKLRAQRRSMLVEAVSTVLFRVAASGPTVVIFDDVHCADRASLALLRRTMRLVDRMRVLVCLTYRDDCRPTAEFAYVIDEIDRLPMSQAVSLGGLDADEVAEWLRELAIPDADDLSAVLHARTGGNCFFLEQIVRASIRDPRGFDPQCVPDTVNEVVRLCVVSLSEPARRALAAAAAYGVEVPRSSIDVDVVDELLDRRLLVECDGGGYRFTHPIVRDVVVGLNVRRSAWGGPSGSGRGSVRAR